MSSGCRPYLKQHFNKIEFLPKSQPLLKMAKNSPDTAKAPRACYQQECRQKKSPAGTCVPDRTLEY